jgi:hypothetical protein
MKTGIVQLTLATLLTGVLGCSKTNAVPQNTGGNPLPARWSYDVITGAGTNSWFARSGTLPPDSVSFQVALRGGGKQLYKPEVLLVHGRPYLEDKTTGLIDFENEVKPASSTADIHERLLYLGRLDVDTLRVEASPKEGALEELRFYYNGRLSASYNLRANPSLRDSLYTARPGLIVPLHKFSRR